MKFVITKHFNLFHAYTIYILKNIKLVFIL